MITQKRPGLFLVSRTSCRDGQPHERAFLADLEQVQTFDLSKYRETPQWFYQAGTNHRRVGDVGTRMTQGRSWLIEVEDLIAFMKEVGEIIISMDDGWPSIEIYDSYRE